jgi:arsenite-transporting ATPase
MRLLLYTGKGGVGKTTTSAATAVLAAERGHRTLVISADAAHSLGDVLGERLGPDARELTPRLFALEVDARAEIERHWGRIHEYLVSLFRYQGIEEVVAEELALLPGAEELAALLAVEEAAASGRYDLVVVDCAPTDTTLRLLTLPDVAHGALRLLLRVHRAVSSVITPLAKTLLPVPLPDPGVFRDLEQLLYQRLGQLRERTLSDQTSVRMVVTPERMVIDEARRAFTELSLFELSCDAVVMNRLLPEEATREEFFRDWGRLQEERCQEVEEAFAPLPVLRSLLREDEVVGIPDLLQHGAEIFADADPAARLSTSPRVRFERHAGGYRVHLPLPLASADGLDVAVVEDDLIVRAGSRRRSLKLPPRIALLDLSEARLDGGELVVSFAVAAVAS